MCAEMPYHGFQAITETQAQICGSDQEASLTGNTS